MTIRGPEATGAPRPAASDAFVGRAAEVAALRAAATGEGPALVVVGGPPGVGKSSLVGHALPGAVYLRAERDEQELAYGVLSRLLAALEPAAAFEPVVASADPYAVGLALLRQLSPGIHVVVDDAHWADGPSVRALSFAVRRLRAERVTMVLVVRTGEPTGDDLARLLASPAARRHELAGLGRADAAALCARIAGSPLSARVADQLHAVTGGNPLWLTAAAAAAGHDVRIGPGEVLPPPPQYADLVRRDLDRAAPDVRALAEAVAVVGAGTAAEIGPAYAAAGGTGRLGSAIEAAVDAGLVAQLWAGDDRLRPRHALTGAAVYWSIPAAARARLHREAAGAADADRALDHRCAADAIEHDDASLDADIADRIASARIAGEWARAAALTEERIRREGADALWCEAGLDLLRAGELGRAAEAMGRVPATLDSPQLDALRGTLALLTGHPDEAEPLLRRGFRDSAGDVAVAGLCASQLTMMSLNAGVGEETLRWARRSAALTPGDGVTQLMLHASAGVLADGPYQPQASVVPRAGRGGQLAGTGVQRLWRGDESRALRDLRRGRADALEHGPVIVATIAGYYVVECSYRLGDLAGALASSEENIALAHAADLTWMWALAHATSIAPLLVTGRVAEAEEQLALAEAARMGNLADSLWLAVGQARLELARGNPEQALAGLHWMGGWESSAGAGNPNLQPWRLVQAEALLGLGRIGEADAVLAPHAASLRRWPRPWSAVQVARLQGMSLRLRGDLAGAEALLTSAVAAHGRQPSYESALLRAELGGVLRRRGRGAEGRRQVELALTRLRVMGAVLGVDAVGAELDGHPAGGVLTARERMVAALVGEGRTNREVAAALHLSVKTVEFHLGRVFTKLGIRSRGGVATALARADAGTS